MNFFKKTRHSNNFNTFLILIGMCLILAVTVSSKFLTVSNITNVIRQFSFIAIMALGMLLVIITGGIDLSVGSVFAFSGIITCIAITTWGLPVWVGVLLGLMAGAIFGYINGTLITRLKLPPFIATLGTMSIARGLSYGITGGYPIGSLPDSFKFIGLGMIPSKGPIQIPTPIILMVIFAIIFSFYLKKTISGRHIYAIGGNEEATRISGVRVDRVKRLVYTLCGLMAAIAGIATAARLGVGQSTAGQGYEMDVIAAVIIGGASVAGGSGSVMGVIIGAAIMGILDNGLVLLNVSAYWQQAVLGMVVIAVVSFDKLKGKSGGKFNNNGKLKTIIFASILVLALVLGVGSKFIGHEKKDVIEIAVVPKSLDNAIFLDTKYAAEEKGKELGIKIYWEGSTTSDAASQVNVIESLIERQVDGILISCNDADALKDVINRAVDSGIVVGCFDSDSPDSNRVFYCGTNNYLIGKLAAEFMLDYLPDGGKVAILTGILGAPNLEVRLDGFIDTLSAGNPNIEILPIQTGEDDVQKSVDVVAQYTAANPDLAAWFFAGGWPYFADPDALPEIKAFMENGGHIVSIDTCYPMMQFVGMDMVDVLVGQNYSKMGSLGVETLYKIIMGEDVDLGDESNFIDTGYEVVDKTNYEEVWASKIPW